MIPFGEFAPDQPAFNSGGQFTTIAKNVVPLTANSYGPLRALTAQSNALAARCQGAASFRDPDGNVFSFAGDETKLYKLLSAVYSDVSNGTYATADDSTWRFAAFGSTAIATNFNAVPQKLVMGTDATFSNLATSMPVARHVAIVKDFVMLGNINDALLTGDGVVPNRIHWSGINAPTSWPTPGTAAAASAQSDFQDLPTGGAVQGVIGAVGGTDGAVFLDNAIYRCVFEGPPTIFGFYHVENERGTPAANSVVNIGDAAFYLGEDGFYVFNGQDSTQIGNQKVDKAFYAELNQELFHLVIGAADTINKFVFWIYCTTGNSVPNKAIIYNWALNRWSHAEFDSQYIFQDLTQGYTLDGLDALGTNIDDSSVFGFSLDSRIWTSGRPALSAFDSTNKVARFGGDTLAAVLETQEIGGSDRIFVNGIRPYVEGNDSFASLSATVALKYRDEPTGSITTSSAAVIDADGEAHFTQSARYVRAQINLPSGADWDHAVGIDADIQVDGSN